LHLDGYCRKEQDPEPDPHPDPYQYVTDPEHRLIEWLTASISTEKRKKNHQFWDELEALFGDWENRIENTRS
jgi:hypothetical protein